MRLAGTSLALTSFQNTPYSQVTNACTDTTAQRQWYHFQCTATQKLVHSWASGCFAKLKVSTCILPQSLLQFSGIPSRKRRKLSADVVAACGRKVRPQQVSCEGGGLGERLRLQGEAVCVSCHRSLSLLPPTMKSNTLNTTFTTVNFTTDPKTSGAVACALCVLYRLPNIYADIS